MTVSGEAYIITLNTTHNNPTNNDLFLVPWKSSMVMAAIMAMKITSNRSHKAIFF